MTPQQQQDLQNNYSQQSSGFPYYANYPGTFDPNSSATQLMMSNNRNLNSGVRLISPMLINANNNQSLLTLSISI